MRSATGRLDEIPRLILKLVVFLLPNDARKAGRAASMFYDLREELKLTGVERLPITRLYRGLNFSLSLLMHIGDFRGASWWRELQAVRWTSAVITGGFALLVTAGLFPTLNGGIQLTVYDYSQSLGFMGFFASVTVMLLWNARKAIAAVAWVGAAAVVWGVNAGCCHTSTTLKITATAICGTTLIAAVVREFATADQRPLFSIPLLPLVSLSAWEWLRIAENEMSPIAAVIAIWILGLLARMVRQGFDAMPPAITLGARPQRPL